MNRYIFLFATLIFSSFLVSCIHQEPEPLVLLYEEIITTVPSASGIVCKGENIWMVGDDASALFELDKDNKIKSQHQVSFMNREENGRLLKSIKPDFESMDFFDDKILIMGSGSKNVSRDTAILFDFKKQEIIAKPSFRPLFERFLFMGGFDSVQSINMEGLASDTKYFYLLNRGNVCGKNIVFQIEKEDMLDYIVNGSLPEIQLHFFDLPEIDGYLSGFSGACISPDQNYLIYTSSVESTTDVYHDGDVLGSFIGLIPIKGDKAWSTNFSYPVKKNDSIVITKLESVCVESFKGKQLNLVCVSDNDNGESGIYKIIFNTDIISIKETQ